MGRPSLLVIGPRGMPDAEGGVERYAAVMLPKLVERGFEVSATVMKQHTPVREHEGVKLIRLPSAPALWTDKHLYLALSFLQAALRRPRVVYLLGSASLLTVPLKLLGLKVYARCGSMDTLSRKWGRVARFVIWLSQRQYRYADGVVAVSRELLDYLRNEHGVRRLVHIPNGVAALPPPAADSGAGPRVKAPYILAVGRITYQKDYPTLARAFARLADPSVTLAIAGSPDGSVNAEETAELSRPGIERLGFVDRGAVAGLLRGAAVFVNSSIKEGMSNALLEAVAAGVPVIASDIPANSELGLPPQCLFPAGDPDALAAKLTEALRDPDRFRVPADAFPGWDAVADQTAALLGAREPARATPVHAAGQQPGFAEG